jgi:hypothetical protein
MNFFHIALVFHAMEEGLISKVEKTLGYLELLLCNTGNISFTDQLF